MNCEIHWLDVRWCMESSVASHCTLAYTDTMLIKGLVKQSRTTERQFKGKLGQGQRMVLPVMVYDGTAWYPLQGLLIRHEYSVSIGILTNLLQLHTILELGQSSGQLIPLKQEAMFRLSVCVFVPILSSLGFSYLKPPHTKVMRCKERLRLVFRSFLVSARKNRHWVCQWGFVLGVVS